MAQQGAALLMKVVVDTRDAEKKLKAVEGAAASIQKASARERVRVSRDTEREETASGKRRQASASQTASAIVKDIDREIAADKRLVRSAVATREAIEREYDKQAKASDKAFETIRNNYRKADREAARAQGPSAGSRFGQAVLSSRYNLPGTAGNIMPLVGQSLRGGAAGAAGLAATAIASVSAQQAKEAIDLAADLEQNMNVLRQATGATDAQMKALTGTARKLGADLTLPATSSNDAARAMLELSKNGLQLTDVMDAAKGVLQLSAAAGIDAGEAARYVATQLNAFKLSGDKAVQVADLLSAASQQSSASVNDLAVASQQAASTYQAAGFTVQDLTADVLQMAKAGIIGSDAGTSLRTAFNRLQNPTDKARELLEKYNIAVFDSSGKLLSHRQIIANVTAGLKGLTQERRSEAVATIFGEDAQRAANNVLGAGVRLNDQIAKKISEVGAASKIASSKMQGFKGAVDGFNSALDSFKEKRAAPFLNFLTEGVQKGSKFLDIMDGYIDRLNTANSTTVKPNSVLSFLSGATEFTAAGILAKGAGGLLGQIEADNQTAANQQAKDNDPIRKAAIRKQDALSVYNTLNTPDSSKFFKSIAEYQKAFVASQQEVKAATKALNDLIKADNASARSRSNPFRVGESSTKGKGSGGGGSKTRPESVADLVAQADSVKTEGQLARLMDAYAKQGGTNVRGKVGGVIERLYNNDLTIAKTKRDKGVADGDTRSQAEFQVDIAQINERRRKRYEDLDKAEAELVKQKEAEAKEATKQAEAAREKTREDKLQADEIKASTQADTTRKSFENNIEALSMAATPEGIARLEALMNPQLDAIQKQDKDAAFATLRRDKARDPKNVSTAYATYQANVAKAEFENVARINQMNAEIAQAQKRLADQAKEQAEEQEKLYKEGTEWYKSFLESEEKGANLALEESRSMEESNRLIEQIVDIRQRKAVLESELTNDPLLAFQILKNAGLEIGQFRASAGQQSLERAGIDLSGTSSYSEDDLGEMVTVNRDGGELKMSKREAESLGLLGNRAGREQGREIEQSFDRGITNLFGALGQNEEGRKAALRDFLTGQIDSLQGVAASSMSEEFNRVMKRELTGKDGVLKGVFEDISKGLKDNVKGLDLSAKGLLSTGMGLYGLANILGAGGKKKQTSSIIGGVLGFAAGSIIPGLGNLQGAGIGAAVGSFFGFANGTSRMPMNMASWVGEREPELIVPPAPNTMVLNGKQIDAVRSASGGDGGIVNNFYGPVSDRLDVAIVDAQQERKRQRKALVS